MSEIQVSSMVVNGSEAIEQLAVSLSKTPPPVVQISRVKDEEERGTDGSEIESMDSQASLSVSDTDDDDQFVDAEEELNMENKENGQKNNERKSKIDIDNNNVVWQQPDDDLQEKIVKQVEFYFSDVNITKDAFLLKHVKRNREGYVSLKLITSFKKVKKITKDWRTVRYSLQQKSVALIVNSDGKKVRRRDPLPDYDETTPSRTVIVVNLPSTNPTIESVNELFKECGDIGLVRIIRPGTTIPPDVRRHMAKHYEIGNALCALVEFEKSESAMNAVKLMSDDNDWRTGMHVTLLAPNKKEVVKMKNDGRESLSPQQRLSTPVGSGAESDGSMKGDVKRRRRQKKKKNRIEQLVRGDDNNSSSEPDYSPLQGKQQPSKAIAIPQSRSPNQLSPVTTPKSSPLNSPHSSPRGQRKFIGRSPLADSNQGSPRNSPRTSPETGRKRYEGSPSEGGSRSPWVQRRRLMASESGASPVNGNSPVGSPKVIRHSPSHATGIIRNPKGPDGTHGFAASKGRGKFIPVC